MATLIVYGDAGDGFIDSTATLYSAAREGTGTKTASAAGTNPIRVGQYHDGTNPHCYELLEAFDTTPITAEASVSAAVLDLVNQQDATNINATFEARLRDWGATLEAADFVAGSALGGLTLLATFASGAGMATGTLVTFTNVAMPANIVRGGFTRLLLNTDRHRTGQFVSAGQEEYIAFYAADNAGTSFDPKLTITYVAPPAALAGAVAGVSTVTGALRVVARLAGTVAGSSTVTGSLTALPVGPPDVGILFRGIGTDGTPGPWRAIECQVFGVGWNRGSTEWRGVFSIPEASQATAYLIDPGRDLDPGNATGAYAGEIAIGAEFKITVNDDAAFTGRITDLSHELEPNATDPIPLAKITALDPQGKLAGVDIAGYAAPAESTSLRIARILDLAQAATGAGDRDIEAGGLPLGPATFSGDAWSELVDVVLHEGGSVEWLPDGKIRTRLRATMWPATPPAPVLDLGCHPDAIPLLRATFESERSAIRNRVRAGVGGAGWGTRSDTASINRYGLRELLRENMTYDNGDGQGPNRADTWSLLVLAHHAAPPVTWRLNPYLNRPDQITTIANVPLFTGRARVTIEGYGPDIDLDELRLIGVAWSIDDAGATATLTLGGDG